VSFTLREKSYKRNHFDVSDLRTISENH
jgi:hypothetical protein